MNYRVFDEDNPIYPKIHNLMSEFNFKYRKEKSTPEYEMMVDTGFMVANHNVYLYAQLMQVIQSEILDKEITHRFEDYIFPDMVVCDYLFTIHRINSILIKYWKMRTRMFREERIDLFYPQIQELMYEFNKKYLKDKWEILTKTGFLKSNSSIYLYKGNREIIISEIFQDRITNYGNFTMSEDIINDYSKVINNVKPILIEYWHGGKE